MRIVLALMGAVFLAASPTLAHDLGVEVRIRGDLVRVEVFFDDGGPGAKARIQVMDANDRVIAEGQADAAGVWSFPKPVSGTFRLTADTGDGHRQHITFTVPADATIASEVVQGDRRDTFTRTRWLGLLVGVLILLGIPVVARVVRSGLPQTR